jgi:hypothetical protein
MILRTPRAPTSKMNRPDAEAQRRNLISSSSASLRLCGEPVLEESARDRRAEEIFLRVIRALRGEKLRAIARKRARFRAKPRARAPRKNVNSVKKALTRIFQIYKLAHKKGGDKRHGNEESQEVGQEDDEENHQEEVTLPG